MILDRPVRDAMLVASHESKAPVLLPWRSLPLLAAAVPASAEIVFLSSGRTLVGQEPPIDGDQIVLTLRSGGEVTCDKT